MKICPGDVRSKSSYRVAEAEGTLVVCISRVHADTAADGQFQVSGPKTSGKSV